MKVFVINLEKDSSRRASIIHQCECVHLQVEIVAGVDGRTLSAQALQRDYDRKKARRIQCRDLVPAEIGCALSHIYVYRKMIECNIPVALILEDDVVLPENLTKVLNALEHLPCMKSPSVILLSPGQGYESRAKPLTDEHSLVPYRTGFYTHAYVITMEGARVLLKELYPVADVADCWARLRRLHIVSLFIVIPCLVIQDQIGFGSSTTEDLLIGVPQKSRCAKLLFKFQRAFWLFYDLFVFNVGRFLK